MASVTAYFHSYLTLPLPLFPQLEMEDFSCRWGSPVEEPGIIAAPNPQRGYMIAFSWVLQSLSVCKTPDNKSSLACQFFSFPLVLTDIYLLSLQWDSECCWQAPPFRITCKKSIPSSPSSSPVCFCLKPSRTLLVPMQTYRLNLFLVRLHKPLHFQCENQTVSAKRWFISAYTLINTYSCWFQQMLKIYNSCHHWP